MPGWIAADPDGLDLWSAGKRSYLVTIEYSWQGRRDTVRLPVVVVAGGSGERVMVSGGTHGDEYEGQYVAAKLAGSVTPEDVAGTLILVPNLNRPAAMAGTRRSPIDGIDINRIFPGDDSVGPSHAIASFVSGRLISSVDVVIDIHSGGVATEFVLSSNLQGRLGDPRTEAELPALLSCDAPYAIVFDEAGDLAMPHRGTLEGAARAMGKRAFSSEFGGGGRMSSESVTVAESSVRNLLAYLKVLPSNRRPPSTSRSRLIALNSPDQHVAAPVDGHFLPRIRLGETVSAGRLLGDLYATEAHDYAAVQIHSPRAGIVVGIASSGVQRVGNCLFYVGKPIAR